MEIDTGLEASRHATQDEIPDNQSEGKEAKGINSVMALHFVAWKRHEATAKLLLDRGTVIEAKDTNGDTALRLAVVKGHEALSQLLLVRGPTLRPIVGMAACG